LAKGYKRDIRGKNRLVSALGYSSLFRLPSCGKKALKDLSLSV